VETWLNIRTEQRCRSFFVPPFTYTERRRLTDAHKFTMAPLTISAGSGADDGSHPWNGGRGSDSRRYHE